MHPQYLPKPRDLLHEKRTGKTGKLNVDECKISANEAIPQCSKYQQMLANEKLKKEFISYLMKQFIELGEDSNLSANIILDYEDIECPCAIYEGTKIQLEMLKNNNGEADYSEFSR